MELLEWFKIYISTLKITYITSSKLTTYGIFGTQLVTRTLF